MNKPAKSKMKFEHKGIVYVHPRLEESLKDYFIKISHKLYRTKNVGSITLNDSQRETIWKMCANTNRRFRDISGIDVGKFGYPI